MSLLDTASLIVTPNGYKEGKLYSVIPSDGSGDLSVTRATTATRVNSAGLVELVPYNFAQYSQDFTNGVWGVAGYGNIATIVANDTIAPDGTMTASKATFTAAGTQGRLIQSIAKASGQSYNASFYLKQGSKSSVTLYSDAASIVAYVTFDFTTGTITSSSNVSGSLVQNVGNGWYRVSFNSTTSISTAQLGFITQIGEDGFIYIWGAQLVEGSTAKDYQKTETRLNIPRLDYSNGTCPSLLVEPQRTNLIPYSSSFDNSAWLKDNNGSGSLPVITANYATAPDGTMSADRAQFSNIGGSGAGANYSLLIYAGLTLSATGTATIYLKSNTSSNQEVLVYWAGGQGDVFEVTPEWQRFTLSNLTATTSGFVFGTRGGSGSFFNGGDEVLDILVWGAQLEAGSYATSYIPTTSASVTRNADVISKTGISSLIGQTEGTLFVDVYRENLASPFIFMIANSVGSNAYLNSIYMFQQANGTIVSDGFISGTLQFSFSTSGLSVGRHKLAIAYKQNDFVWYIDGVQVATDTSGNVPTMSAFEINGADISSTSNVETNAVALWKTRLTNTQLAQLTTI
jgi:hypothetical protein